MSFVRKLRVILKPPPKLSLSEWADRYYYLSAENSAEPGQWKTISYQKEIMDSITDPKISQVSLMKSARIGATKMLGAVIGYHMEHDPCPMMIVQPTVKDAEGYSKEEIAPMLRDCKVLRDLVVEQDVKKSSSTILSKSFPGGVLSMIGANSGAGFRRVSRRVVMFDEVDGYPPSAGVDGDPIKLGMNRARSYFNRTIVAVSTPLVQGASRIEDMFMSGDRRRMHVACPQCGNSDIFVFKRSHDGVGHYMQWPDGEPENAYFVCSKNGCVIDHSDKFDMIDGGKWVAEKPCIGHASFHLWAAYSFSPNDTWGDIATEFVEANNGSSEKLRTFMNTVCGETFREKGEAPAWRRLYTLREQYQIGSIPEGVVELTCGVDVQKDRLVYEVVGWGHSKESWSIEHGLLFGDTSDTETWEQLADLLDRQIGTMQISLMAVDSGYNTQQVYSWCRKYPMNRVIAVKGRASSSAIIDQPSPVDITEGGRRRQRGYKVWPVGVDLAKAEFYGWLRLSIREDGTFPRGYCHFPEYAEDFFRQITSEHLVLSVKKSGHKVYTWKVIPGRENHLLDCRIYARAAASLIGLDTAEYEPTPKKAEKPLPKKSPTTLKKKRKSWLKG